MFQICGKLYRYSCLPNSLACWPRLFTKLLDPILKIFHKKGHIIADYLDDIYIQAAKSEKCTIAVVDKISAFTEVGFIIHPN